MTKTTLNVSIVFIAKSLAWACIFYAGIMLVIFASESVNNRETSSIATKIKRPGTVIYLDDIKKG